MEREDWESSESCALCGGRVWPDSEGCFAFGTENFLCASCAAERGGRYDARRGTWETEPDLSGLADEAYGSSPHEVRRSRG